MVTGEYICKLVGNSMGHSDSCAVVYVSVIDKCDCIVIAGRSIYLRFCLSGGDGIIRSMLRVVVSRVTAFYQSRASGCGVCTCSDFIEHCRVFDTATRDHHRADVSSSMVCTNTTHVGVGWGDIYNTSAQG